MFAQVSISAALIVTTVIIHAVSLELILNAFHAVRTDIQVRWRAAAFGLVILAVFIAHVVEILVWAIFYYLTASIEVIPTLEAAVYFSASSFTTVGFGDLVLSEEWRLLSSFESVNGMILFGWSTAFIFEVYRHIYRQLYPDVRADSSP